MATVHKPFLLNLENKSKFYRFQVKEFLYTGSIYEGLKIGKPDEFDIMVVIDASDLKETPTNPGFFFLKTTGKTEGYAKISVGNQVSSTKTMDVFFGFLVKAIDELQMGGKVKPRRHGPAVQIDINERGIQFSIDVVPAFKLANKDLYVAKAPKGGNPNAWRRSTSLIEKDVLTTIDSGNKIKRHCVRILKAICEKEAGFKLLYSYHFKTALLHLNDRSDLKWTPADLGPRTMDLLEYLQRCLEKKRLPHKYVPQINLLEGKDAIACDGLANRIKRLRSNEAEFCKLIQV